MALDLIINKNFLANLQLTGAPGIPACNERKARKISLHFKLLKDKRNYAATATLQAGTLALQSDA
jgi:hypothetical protein